MDSRIRILVLGLVALAGLVSLTGCGGGPEYVMRSNFIEFPEEMKVQRGIQSSREYRIQEGDILRVSFSYHSELNQDGVVVLPDGAVGLTGIDRVRLAGRTMTEADSLITARYAKEYLDPELSVAIQETQGRRVYVMGEVRNPGLHRVPTGGLDMIGAVTVAGGFTEDAATNGCVLVRVTDEGYACNEVDLSGFSNVNHFQLGTVFLESYDIIYVPRSRIGDFAYFSRTVLAGLVQITRMAVDIYYLTGGNYGRF